MFYVYLLESTKYKQTYIGSTNDLRRRLREHNDGLEISTRRYKPWRLVAYEAYQSEQDAREREKRLKSHGNAIKEFKKRARNSLKNGAGFTHAPSFSENGQGLPSTTFSKSGAGFTLIELLVSMTIFSVVMISAISLFSAGIKNQRKALALQTLSDNASYVMEYMSRTIRMAKKDLKGNYIKQGCNFEPWDGEENYIKFLNYDKEEQEFKLDLDNGQIKEKRGSAPFTALTSDDLKVNKLAFRVSGGCQTDGLQPKVTIVMEIQTKEAEPQILNLQTTISQRDLDIEY